MTDEKDIAGYISKCLARQYSDRYTVVTDECSASGDVLVVAFSSAFFQPILPYAKEKLFQRLKDKHLFLSFILEDTSRRDEICAVCNSLGQDLAAALPGSLPGEVMDECEARVNKMQSASKILHENFSDLVRIPFWFDDNGRCHIESIIGSGSAESSADAESYINKLGGFCCLLLAFEVKKTANGYFSSDGEFPVITDLAVLVQDVHTAESDLLDHIDPALGFSLYTSDLLFHYINMKETSILFSKDSPLLPEFNGKTADLADERFETAFLEGFSAAYERCMSLKCAYPGSSYMCKADLEFETGLLRASIRNQDLNRFSWRGFQSESLPKEKYKFLSADMCLEEARRLFNIIKSRSLATPGGFPFFSYVPLSVNTRMRLSGMGLSKGLSGICIFTAALYRTANDRKLKAEAREYTDLLLSRLDKYISYYETLPELKESICTISFSEGLGGTLHAMLVILKFTDDHQLELRLHDLIKRVTFLILRADVSSYLPDYFNGLGGTLNVMCSDDEVFSLPGVPDFCRKMADRIMECRLSETGSEGLWPMLTMKKAVSGIAHGQCGIASSLMNAGTRLNDDRYIQAARKGFDFEDAIFDEALGFWPDLRPIGRPDIPTFGYCTGASGIGKHMLRSESILFKANLDRALHACVSSILQAEDHLCCGNCAVIDFLIDAGAKSEDREMIAKANRRMAESFNRAHRSNSPDYITPNGSMSQTLFFGLSGIGYTILRLADSELLPSPLL